MPCFNSENFIEDAIESILNQTYENFEFFILDDGSTDRTTLKIQGFKDSRIKLLCENENKGIVYQLNKGIDLARGKYIARMDADDVSFPDRLQKQVDFLESPMNRNVDVLGTNAIKIGKEGGVIEFKNYTPQQISFLLNFYCPILHPTVMIRKSIFDNGLRYSEDYKYAEDLALWRTIDNGRNIAILNEYLLSYRIHNNQTNRSNVRKETQKDSTLRALGIKNNRRFDAIRFFLGKNYTKRLWQDFDDKINGKYVFGKFYLYLRAKQLKIVSSMFFSLIKQC